MLSETVGISGAADQHVLTSTSRWILK